MSAGSVAAASAGEVGAAPRLELARRRHAVGETVVRRVDHVDLLQRRQLVAHLEEPGEEAGVLDDRHLGAGMAGEVLDLLRATTSCRC